MAIFVEIIPQAWVCSELPLIFFSQKWEIEI